MELVAGKDDLQRALANASRTAFYPGASPLLSAARMTARKGRLQITGTDGDLTISTSVEADVARPGLAYPPAKVMSDVVKSLPSDCRVSLAAEDDEMSVSAPNADFRVRLLAREGDNADGFAEVPRPGQEPVSVASEDIWDGLSRVLHAASEDQARPILTGVLFESQNGEASVVATDSYRMARRDFRSVDEWMQDGKVIIPARAVKSLLKMVESQEDGQKSAVGCSIGDQSAFFSIAGGDIEMSTRLIAGDYPNHQGLWPTGDPTGLAKFELADMVTAARRAQIMAAESSPLKLSADGEGSISVASSTVEVGQAAMSVNAETDGTWEVSFNPKYLLAGLGSCAGPEATMAIHQQEDGPVLKPVLLTTEGHPEHRVMLMPVRTS